MKKKPSEVDRNIHKSAKKMNREQLTSLLEDVYEKGRHNFDFDELKEVIGAVPGIGETRLAQIIGAIQEYYGKADTE